MATHEERCVDFVLETMSGMSKNRRRRAESHSLQSSEYVLKLSTAIHLPSG
jgi:hypothetical protein